MSDIQRLRERIQINILESLNHAIRETISVRKHTDYSQLKDREKQDDFRKSFIEKWNELGESLIPFIQKTGSPPPIERASNELEDWIRTNLEREKDNFTPRFVGYHKQHIIKFILKYLV